VNTLVNKQTQFIDLGLIDYQQAWVYQTQLFEDTIRKKIKNRELPGDQQLLTNNYLIFCEHPHVFTLGKSGDESNLLIKKENLSEINATYVPINRGGDITYHGPGQIVGYPILDLDNFFTDIHKYLRYLEEAVILTLADYGIEAGRIDGLTGVWIDHIRQKNPRKICAIGVKSSRWVTMHGFAFNVNTDLSYFDYIIPCGIADKAVTSLSQELGKSLSVPEVEARLKLHLAALFEMELIEDGTQIAE
jgi:lipoyl(octanoyl) transferase